MMMSLINSLIAAVLAPTIDNLQKTQAKGNRSNFYIFSFVDMIEEKLISPSQFIDL